MRKIVLLVCYLLVGYINKDSFMIWSLLCKIKNLNNEKQCYQDDEHGQGGGGTVF